MSVDTDRTQWLDLDAPPPAPPRRRVRGLRLTALPSMALLAQIVGGGAALVGVYLAWGLAVSLMVGGVVAAALGALREAGKV